MFPVCELVQSKGFDFPLLDHWSHSFAVGIIVCFVFCVILYYFFVVFLPSLRSVFMQTKAFGFAFPSHRSHFTRELWRLPATGASTVNSPCEIRRQLYKYADTNTSAQTIQIRWPFEIILIFAELWRSPVTDLSGRSLCQVRILDCLVHWHCQGVSDQLWLEVTKRPIVMAAVMSNYLDKWQQLLQTMPCGENFHSWRQP